MLQNIKRKLTGITSTTAASNDTQERSAIALVANNANGAMKKYASMRCGELKDRLSGSTAIVKINPAMQPVNMAADWYVLNMTLTPYHSRISRRTAEQAVAAT